MGLKDVDLAISAAGDDNLPLLAALSRQWHAAVDAGQAGKTSAPPASPSARSRLANSSLSLGPGRASASVTWCRYFTTEPAQGTGGGGLPDGAWQEP